MRPVRVSVKALIVRDGKLLAQKNVDATGPWYISPGGGQHPGETLHQALKRECLEEIGSDIEIGDIRFVRDYIGSKHEFASIDSGLHQVEIYFACQVPSTYEPTMGPEPDKNQVAIEWLEIAQLDRFRFFPRALGELLSDAGQDLIYLGEVN